jgi:CRISPR-associated protein Csd2
MNTPDKLHHNLIELPKRRVKTPDGKERDLSPADPVGERHEFVLLFDCAKSNPNGDPDTGNMPRVQPDSLKGLVTDVCLKRKIRNFFTLYCPHDGEPRAWRDENGQKEDRGSYDIFIREGAVLQELFDPDTKKADALEIEKLAKEIFVNELGQKIEAWTAKESKKGKGKKGKGKAAEAAPAEDNEGEAAQGEESAQAEEASPAKQAKQRAFQLAVLRTFFDLRAFGGVLSTEGPLKGSFYGQIRGPLQFTFSESLDKVLPLDATITRCAVASVDEAKKQVAAESGDSRTMGRKYGIDYGLYRCHIHLSPAFAAKTRFTYYDLDNFLFALVHMFDDDHAAGRHLRLVGLVDFQHQSALGNAPAHRLFELVQVEGVKRDKDGKPVFAFSDSEFPRSLDDYSGEAPEGELHVTQTGEVKPGRNGEGVAVIKAKRLMWEIPPKQSNGKSS